MLRFTLSAASAFFFFVPFSYAAAGFIAVSQVSSQTQRNISINDAVLESSSSFASHVFHFFASLSLSFLQFLLCVGDSSSAFMWFFLLESWIPVLKSSFDYS